jgi:hypothetical protein
MPEPDAVHVTPGAAVTLIVPDRLPPAHPPADPRLSEGVTASVTPLVNVADTDWCALMVTLQTAVPEQAPPQLAKVESADGTGVSPTTVLAGNEVPVGNDAIEPLPLPFVLKASVYRVDGGTTRVVVSNVPPAGASGTFSSVVGAPVFEFRKVSPPGMNVATPELSNTPPIGGGE